MSPSLITVLSSTYYFRENMRHILDNALIFLNNILNLKNVIMIILNNYYIRCHLILSSYRIRLSGISQYIPRGKLYLTRPPGRVRYNFPEGGYKLRYSTKPNAITVLSHPPLIGYTTIRLIY